MFKAAFGAKGWLKYSHRLVSCAQCWTLTAAGVEVHVLDKRADTSQIGQYAIQTKHSLDDPGVGRADIIVVCDQVDVQPRLLKLSKGEVEVRLQLSSISHCQDGLMNLHLWHTQRLELLQDLAVSGKKALDHVSGGDSILLGQTNQGIGS